MDFNSRPHEEVDRQLRSIKCHRLHFNSRPREEVDEISLSLFIKHNISTHDLTKRSTFFSAYFIMYTIFQLTTSRRGRQMVILCEHGGKIISTHDLTKRSTCVFAQSRWAWYYFNSRPHKEVDQSNSQKHLCY